MKRTHFLLIGLCLLASSHASAQQWQSYQLTNYGQNGAVARCGSVGDTLGNLHHYFICGFAPDFNYLPLLYMRTDFYGHILTDTVRVNGFSGPVPLPSFAYVVGDGSHSWCIFSDRDPSDGIRGLYMTERDTQGNEVFPARLLGRPAGGGAPQSYDLSATLDYRTGVIHVVGNLLPSHYYRFTTAGDTLLWQRPIDGLVGIGEGPTVIISPADHRPWYATRHGYSPNVSMLVVRFGEDTSQTVFHPLASSTAAWSPANTFGMDSLRNSYFLAGNDTVARVFLRLDSTFQVIEEQITVHSRAVGNGTLRTDSAGNTLVLWSCAPYGLFWAYRRADGTWTHPLTSIDSRVDAYSPTIAVMDSERFAFTFCGGLMPANYEQVWLYTYGFPPYNSTSPSRPLIKPASIALSIHPNPFNNSARIGFDLTKRDQVKLEVFDDVGRHVRTLIDAIREAGHHETVFNGEGLASGVYFVRLRSGGAARTEKLVMMK